MNKKAFEEPKFYIFAFQKEDMLSISNLENFDNTGSKSGVWGDGAIFGD